MGYIGPIPSSSLRPFAEKYGKEAAAFTYCIRRMDAAYLELVRDKKPGDHVIHSRPFGPSDMRKLGKGA